MRALVVVGLLFGDEGKGAVVDALTRHTKAKLIVRFNGGSQCAHNVITPDGRHHTFAQLGSGTFAGASTFLSRYMLVNPIGLLRESDEIRSKGIAGALDNVYVDRRALVTTPYHRALNRLREISRGKERHGSCGMGIGETMDYAIKHPAKSLCVADLQNETILINKLNAIRMDLFNEANGLPFVLPSDQTLMEMSTFDSELLPKIASDYLHFIQCVHVMTRKQTQELLISNETVIFEGAQGVLLDEHYGFQPHTTWSKTTTENAHLILSEIDNYGGKINCHEIGVARTYATRHGAGPLPTEVNLGLTDSRNPSNPWQREFRTGWLDLPLLRYAVECNGGINSLAITHTDVLKSRPKWKVCAGYENARPPDMHRATPVYVTADDVVRLIQQDLGIRMSIESCGPSATEKMINL